MKKILLTILASSSLIAIELPDRPGEDLTRSDTKELLIEINRALEKIDQNFYLMHETLSQLYNIRDILFHEHQELKEVAKGINTLVWYMEHPADEIKYTPKK